MLNYAGGLLTDQQRRCIPDVHFELIPIDQLVSDQNYQRTVSDKHVLSTAEEFDVYQLRPVKVSRREGINYVTDGQHSCEIVARVSGSRSTPVWCMVYDDLDYKTEASIFADQQKHTKALSPYEVFNAHIEAGDEKQMLIKKTCQSYGLELSGKRITTNHICAVSTLEKIFDKYGFETLDSVLRISVGTWQGQTNSMSGYMLLGIARLYATYKEVLDEVEFRNQVGKQPVSYLIRLAKERGRGHLGYAEALIEVYNGTKKKNGLNPMGLHGGPLTFTGAAEVKRRRKLDSKAQKEEDPLAENEQEEPVEDASDNIVPEESAVENVAETAEAAAAEGTDEEENVDEEAAAEGIEE